MDPVLTVVIVSYNCREVLLDCLASIEASRQEAAFRVCVVDNASADGTPEAVRRLHPGVELTVSPVNLGFSGGNNLVLARAVTPFVLLLNPDTLVGDHCFDRAMAALTANPRAAVSTCRLVTGRGALDLACRRSFPNAWDGFCRAVGLSARFPGSRLLARYNLTFLDEFSPASVDAVNGAFMMVRREAMERVGLLDEDYFMYMEDLDWCWRFRRAGYEVLYEPACTVTHLKGQSSAKESGRMIRAFFDSMELFCVKNTHPEPGLARTLTLAGIRAWKWLTLARNALRAEKRVRP